MWEESVNYNQNDIVQGSDSKYYISLINSNTSNDPTVSLVQWTEIRFLGVWNINEIYSIGDVAQTVNGDLWKAITATAGNDPAIDDGTNWLPAVDNNDIINSITTNSDDIDVLEVLNSWDIPKTADFTGVASESRQVDALSNTVDIALPVLAIGDSFIYHNQITSTFKVQVLNPIETIKGQEGDIAAGVNMEIEPGQSVQMVAKSATVLSIVGVLL